MGGRRRPYAQIQESTDVQEQIAMTAMATQNQGGIHTRRPNKSNDIIQAAMEPEKSQQLSLAAGETMMRSAELQLMTPLLHFLQLLCENHNTKLQVRREEVTGEEGGSYGQGGRKLQARREEVTGEEGGSYRRGGRKLPSCTQHHSTI